LVEDLRGIPLRSYFVLHLLLELRKYIMRKLILITSLLLFLGFAGCGDNPATPANSITHDIKKALPVERIYVHGLYENSEPIKYGPAGRPFDVAFAEDGFLVVVNESGSQIHYNLSKAKSININPQDDISLVY
jgi:hypothetical protein